MRAKDGRKLVVGLAPHTSVTLPSGGDDHVDGVRRWTSPVDRPRPGQRARRWASALLALAGLMLSLFVRRRRVWVRAARRRRRAYARRGGGAGADRGRGRRGPDRRGPRAGRADRARRLDRRRTTGACTVTSRERWPHLSNNLLYSAMAVYAGRDVLLRRRARVRHAAPPAAREQPDAASWSQSVPHRRTTCRSRRRDADEDAARLGKAEPAGPDRGLADGAGVRAARCRRCVTRGLSARPAAVGQHVRVLHDRRAGGHRRLPRAADPQATSATSAPSSSCRCCSRSGSRSPCSTPSRPSWCRR